MDEHTIKSTYEMYKRSAKYHFDKLHFDECLTSIVYACRLAYTFNWIYTDDELEYIVYMIAKHFNITQKVKPIENRIVLYDNFAMSNRGLTQQYLRALVKLDYNILLIITRSPNEIDKKMQQELTSYPKLSIEYVPQNEFTTKIQQIEKIIKLVMEFKPAKAFMHMTPFDVAGNVAWNALSFVQRYQINLTDHAFWLGIKCSDYIIEFRHYGYSLSMQMRHIPKEKLLLLPYYPIYDTESEYQGIPEPLNRAVKLFSGGALYKILDKDYKFVKIINSILWRNPNTIFYFAGAKEQDVPTITSILKKHNLNDRWVFLGNRTDIAKVMEHIDIYIGTYPIGGGLMTQIAAAAAKPIICFQEPSLSNFTNIEQLFHPNLNHKLVFATSNLDEFNRTIDELILSSNKRILNGKLLQSLLFTETDFEDGLTHLLEGKFQSNILNNEIDKIPLDAIFRLFIDIDDKYLHKFCQLNINQVCLKNNPILFLRSTIMYCYYNWRKLPKKMSMLFNKK